MLPIMCEKLKRCGRNFTFGEVVGFVDVLPFSLQMETYENMCVFVSAYVFVISTSSLIIKK
jgi:hypothetical protein